MSLTLSIDASTSATGWAVYDGSQLVESGVIKAKGSFLERALVMASELRKVQLRTIKERKKTFESIVIEKNNVGGVNQQSVIKIGIATGIILGKLIADDVYFVNVSTWRKYSGVKGRGKKELKQLAINLVSQLYQKQVKDDEADAILVGRYFVEMIDFKDGLESHRLSR